RVSSILNFKHSSIKWNEGLLIQIKERRPAREIGTNRLLDYRFDIAARNSFARRKAKAYVRSCEPVSNEEIARDEILCSQLVNERGDAFDQQRGRVARVKDVRADPASARRSLADNRLIQ